MSIPEITTPVSSAFLGDLIARFLPAGDAPETPQMSTSRIKEFHAHGLASLLLRSCGRGIAEDSDAEDALLHSVRKSTALRLMAEAALAEVGLAFAEAGVDAIVVGGLGQSSMGYPFPEDRPVGDVDIIVPAAKAELVGPLMSRLGFSTVYPLPAANFTRGPVIFDIASSPWLGVRLTTSPREAETFPLFSRDWTEFAVKSPVAGLLCLSPAAEFLFQAVHYAYKHAFSRHIWGIDLILLSRRFKETDRDELSRLIKSCQAERLMYYVFSALKGLYSDWEAPVQLEPDRNAVVGALFRRAMAGQADYGFSYLLAFSLSPSIVFRAGLALKILVPPPALREPGLRGVVGHLFSLPRKAVATFGRL